MFDEHRPLMWNHERDPGLIWKWPPAGTGDKGPEKPAKEETPRIAGVAVREFEAGLILKEGRLYAEVASGRDYIVREPIVGRTEVIFVDLRQFKSKWGIGGIIAKDGITTGAHGVVYLKVSNPTAFILNVVAGNERYTTQEVEAWIAETIKGVMRAELSKYRALELQEERESLISLARVKLDEMFTEWGLEFRSLEIEGFQIPEEYRNALQGPAIAQKVFEKSTIEAESQAQTRRITGLADVDVLKALANSGIDPIQLEAVRVLMKYAETPSEGSGAIPADLYKPSVFMNLMSVLENPVIPNTAKTAIREKMSEPFGNAIEEHESRAATSPETGALDTEDFLKKLDMRLINGEISEETYKEIKVRWLKDKG